MNRRRFTALLAGGVMLSAGCNGRLGGSVAVDRGRTRIYPPAAVETVEFVPGVSPVDGPNPAVAFDPDARRVRITGTAWAGTPCDGLVLDSLTYHATPDGALLYGLVVSARLKLDRQCPDSLGEESYEVRVTFASGSELPATVKAEQRDSFGETVVTTATR